MKIKERNRLRKQWKKKFERYDITYCEARISPYCTGRVDGFAHSRKSRFFDEATKNTVIASCDYCHRILDEEMSHEDMEMFVELIIESRDVW